MRDEQPGDDAVPGWLPARAAAEAEAQAELIGYAADGTDVGREPV